MATKEQERKALAQIMTIIEGLGEDSYIGKAFDGCFEIAQENIDNDFGCSMKQRWESEQKEANHFRKLAGKFTDELEASKKEIENLQKKVLPTDDMQRLLGLACQKRISEKEKMEKAASKIVEEADNPNSKDFKNAVEEHRNAKSLVEVYQELIQRVRVAVEEQR